MSRKILIFAIFVIVLLFGFACAEPKDGNGEGTPDLPDDIAALVELLGQPQQGNQNEIIETLAGKGEAAVPELIVALEKGGVAQAGAVACLGRIGEIAVPQLISALETPVYEIRYGAIAALGEIGPDAVEAVDPLMGLFGRSTKTEQVAIMHNLVKISPTGDVVGMLNAALRVDGLRQQAMRSLGDIGPAASGAAPSLLAYLEHENEQTRFEALESLEKIGPVDDKVVEGIAGCADDQVVRVRLLAVKVLGTFGEASGDATSALAAALNDEDPEVQKTAAHSLGLMAPVSSDAIGALINTLSAESPRTRFEAAWALGQFGEAGSSALPALRELQETDSFDYVRSQAGEAIAAIEGTDTGEETE